MLRNKEVIVSVYTESSKPRSLRKHETIKKTKHNVFSLQPRVSRSRGDDRRARLLAYAQELRRCNGRQIHPPFKNFRPKQMRWRWCVPVGKVRSLFSGFRGRSKRWKYEQIKTDDYSDHQMNSRKHKCSSFGKKFKCFWKEIAKSWKCNGNC